LIRRESLDEARAELVTVASLKGSRARDAGLLLAALDRLRAPKPAPEGGTTGIDAGIVKVDGTRAYINIGASAGVRVGDKFSVLHRGELVDPATGTKRAAETPTGTAVVVEVYERLSIVSISGKAVASDVIKKL
jgi:hypothetical protein